MSFTLKKKRCLRCKKHKETKGGTYKNYQFVCKDCNNEVIEKVK